MENLKDHNNKILLVGVIIGIVGVGAYSHQRTKNLDVKLLKFENALKKMGAKITELDKKSNSQVEDYQTLSNQIIGVTQELNSTVDYNEFDGLDYDIDSIIQKLKEKDITIERPSRQMQQPKSYRPNQRSISRPMDRSLDRPMDRSLERPMDRSLDRSLERPNRSYDNNSYGRATDRGYNPRRDYRSSHDPGFRNPHDNNYKDFRYGNNTDQYRSNTTNIPHTVNTNDDDIIEGLRSGY